MKNTNKYCAKNFVQFLCKKKEKAKERCNYYKLFLWSSKKVGLTCIIM